MEKWFPIQTNRLLLREFKAEDECDVHEYGGDPIVSRYTNWGPNTPEASRKILLNRIERQRTWPRAEVDLAIELLVTRKQIGAISLRVMDLENGLGDFGFVLNRSYWNQGFATEAAWAVVDRAFSVVGLHRLVATCDSRNLGSAKVMEKVGMRREAHFRQDVWQRDEWRDSYLYAILMQEWRGLRDSVCKTKSRRSP